MDNAKIQEIVNNRRAQFARLNPVKRKHLKRQDQIWEEKNGIMEKIEKSNEIKSNIGQIPGFYPTPQPLAERMVEYADLCEGDSVLEPSAGAGAIAHEIRKAGIEPLCIEFNWTLAEFLRRDEFDTICGDFLEYKERKFSKIIMNPPFENQQDIDHVFHAWELLEAGGRIVAIMSAGTLYRSNPKAESFRSLISRYGSASELDPGTFKSSGTNVNTILVILERPSNL